MMKTAAMRKTMAFLGAGNMAEALISGMINGGVARAARILISDVRKERRDFLKKKYGVRCADNLAAVRRADVVFLSVKPQHMEGLLAEIGPLVRRDQLVISIAAGITTRFIERFLPKGVPVIRTMPNTPALLRAGAIVIARGKNAGKNDTALAERLLSAAGTVEKLPEAKIDAVTALSGSGPAYVFYLAECMERAGVSMGIPRAAAGRLARQTVFGAGKMLASVEEPASELRRRVTSPGGTTEAAVAYLEKNDFDGIFEHALKRARQRARELSR